MNHFFRAPIWLLPIRSDVIPKPFASSWKRLPGLRNQFVPAHDFSGMKQAVITGGSGSLGQAVAAAQADGVTTLAMLRVLQTAFTTAFGGSFTP